MRTWEKGGAKISIIFASLAEKVEGAPKTKWDEAILDCEEKMLAAGKRLADLELARHTFRDMRERGAAWPEPHNTAAGGKDDG